MKIITFTSGLKTWDGKISCLDEPEILPNTITAIVQMAFTLLTLSSLRAKTYIFYIVGQGGLHWCYAGEGTWNEDCLLTTFNHEKKYNWTKANGSSRDAKKT